MKKREYRCPIDAFLQVVGGRWKVLILWNLREGTRRFGELKKALPDTTQKMLTQQLRELEADEIVKRKVYPQVPPKVEYSLTDFGRTLVPLLQKACAWGETFMERQK